MPSKVKENQEAVAVKQAQDQLSPKDSSLTTAANGSKKRKRTRNRNKARTADSDSIKEKEKANDTSDEEEKPVQTETTPPTSVNTQVATPTQQKSKGSKKAKAESKANESDSNDDDDDDDKDNDEKNGGEQNDKKKRKRKRTRGKNSHQADTLAAPLDAGPDPELDLRLSDQAKKAIQYARVYSTDKDSWKFNKAKQNWLLRNALSCPPAHYDAELAAKKPAEQQQEQPDQNEAEGETFIPEPFVQVVTLYLRSVVGGSKERLIQSVKEALNAPKAPETVTEAEATKTVEPSASVTAAGSSDATVANKPAPKSVSFGDIAMEAENAQEQPQGETASTAPRLDGRLIEQRRERARKILAVIEEP